MARVVTAIDIGSSKVCTLIGEVTDADVIRVVGIGMVPSRGVSHGVITNLEEATLAIGESIQKAERIAQQTVTRAYVAVGGPHISSMNKRGSAAVGKGDRPIDREDLQRALDAAQSMPVTHNRQIIYCAAREYTLDEDVTTKNPLGLLGYTLDVDAHIITANATSINNLANCIRRNHVDIIEYVPQPIASAQAVLSAEEMNDGVAVVDMGGETTSMIIYACGTPFDTHVYPLGGSHFTNDMVVGLHTPVTAAEEIKLRYGHVLTSAVGADEKIDISTFGATSLSTIQRRYVADIMGARMEDILDHFILRDIKRSGYDGLLAAGIVLTGGASQVQGAAELTSAVLQLPARVGVPRRLHGLSETINNPAYATAVGLLLHGMRRETIDKPIPAFESNPKTGSRLLQWLKNILPR
ncbi:MAG: cell division protein FtsA [Chloroflexi bacterium]|nr:cell division protein FtsA [Chloroflexota bacterium]